MTELGSGQCGHGLALLAKRRNRKEKRKHSRQEQKVSAGLSGDHCGECGFSLWAAVFRATAGILEIDKAARLFQVWFSQCFPRQAGLKGGVLEKPLSHTRSACCEDGVERRGRLEDIPRLLGQGRQGIREADRLTFYGFFQELDFYCLSVAQGHRKSR